MQGSGLPERAWLHLMFANFAHINWCPYFLLLKVGNYDWYEGRFRARCCRTPLGSNLIFSWVTRGGGGAAIHGPPSKIIAIVNISAIGQPELLAHPIFDTLLLAFPFFMRFSTGC
jgi:hypothetical protein